MTALMLLMGMPAHAQGPAAAPVEELDQGLVGIMKQGKATPFAERMATLTPIVEQVFNLPTILQEAVGPRYASIPPAQQAELLQAFTAFTVANYVANFDSYKGERFVVSPDPRRAGADTIVETRIVPLSGDTTRLDYVLRGGKVVDILLDGTISRVAVQRSDFRSLLSGGETGPLIAMLRSKTAAFATGAGG